MKLMDMNELNDYIESVVNADKDYTDRDLQTHEFIVRYHQAKRRVVTYMWYENLDVIGQLGPDQSALLNTIIMHLFAFALDQY